MVDSRGADRDSRRTLLALLGAAMVATGQPVHEVEDELREVGRHLGAPDLQVAAGPTGVHVGLGSGELPRLVVFLPSFWLLVPGSLGLIGVSEVAIVPGERSTVAFDVVGVILAISMGLLVGSVVSRALRALVGRLLRTPG